MDDEDYEKELRDWKEAYMEIGKLTGISLEEAVDNNYCLVIKEDHELYGRIGVYHSSKFFKRYFKFKDKRELVRFGGFKKHLDDEIFLARNVIMILEKMRELEKK